MPHLRACTLLLLSLALAGCPDPTPPTPPPGGGAAAGGQEGNGGGGAPPGDAGDGGGAKPPAGDGDGGDGGGPPDWQVIPAAQQEAIYPVLQPLAEWPDPTGLRALSELEAGAAPDPIERQLLEQLVALIVHPDLRPSDFDAALGVDPQGRLFVKLGRSKPIGSASLEVKLDNGYPVFGLVVRDGEEGTSLERLLARAAALVVPDLGRELTGPEAKVHPSPQVNGPRGVAALAMLDRSGAFGIQFPYLYVYASGPHVAVLLQEVPHESGTPAPR